MSKVITTQVQRSGGVAFNLPMTDGTVGHVLQTDGVGNLSVTTVPTTGIADSAVTNAKMADDAVGVAELSATGTPSTLTFLRGDNSWDTPLSGAVSLTTGNLYNNWTEITIDTTTTADPATVNAAVIGPVTINSSGTTGWTIDGQVTIF
tara:strand:+ start:140 stop:586 length:447 start_codon:yes stop_codon:yes gene_type:complete